ncbi:MAG: Rieske 2Fe-2S domain-containing protein [Planctomycetota bacterium]
MSIPTLTVDDFEQLARRVDETVADVRKLSADARRKSLAMKSAVEEFHKLGLTRIVKAMKANDAAREVLFTLVDDPAVHTLFAMHGLIRADLSTRVYRVIDMIAPHIRSSGGEVSVVSVDGKIATLMMQSSGGGCGGSDAKLQPAVEEALREHVPEIESIRWQNPPASLVQIGIGVPKDSQSSLPIATLGVNTTSANTNSASTDPANTTPANTTPANTTPANTGDWFPGPAVSELSAKLPHAFKAGGHEVLVLLSKAGPRAFRNACAHQGVPLDRGHVDVEAGTITCPAHGFQFECDSGECLTAPSCQLEVFPIRQRDGIVEVQIA